MGCFYRHEPVPANGLTVLFEPDEPSIDVVFVHGFTGHPERTWTHRKGDPRSCHQCPDAERGQDTTERPVKVRKLSRFLISRSGPNDAREPAYTSVYWPRDLVPTVLPGARVLTYGYDTRVTHAFGPLGNKSSVYEMAWDFLVELDASRRSQEARPLLFVAHSLGGILVKEALRRSASFLSGRQFRFRSIFDSTVGVIFFGTPHGGAKPGGLPHRVAEKLLKAAGFSVNEQVVATLLPSGERLKELRDEFGPVVNKQNWTIYSFQEAIGVRFLGGEKVVDDTSSCLNLPEIETKQHIQRDHMDMCRFAGFDDPEFKKVDAALRHITGLMQSRHRTPETAPLARVLNEENRRLLLDSLRFEQVDARMMSVRSAHEKTCKWLLKKAEYVDWLDPGKLSDHYGFLWLKGKPGTGKSTLMKFALTNARKSMKDTLVISFFFNARGADMEKSTAGMYRSLLLQLLERVPRLQDVFETLGFTDWNSSSTYVWSIETLKDLFREAIHSLGELAVVCFIDALDECDQAEVRDMVAFFQRLGDLTVPLGVRFRVFFSSRHYPHITISHGIDFVLEGQEGHDQDITDYIDSELHPELRTGDTASLGIRETLQKKSAGVFMWVVLVIGILNKEYDDGEFAASQLRQRQVQRKLDEIPSDLHELFRDILTRDARKKDRLILSLQWLLFARRPLRPAELYFAIISGIEPTDLPAYISSQPGLDQMEKFILNSSKGLAEVIKSKKPTVQFIHESVRDFLIKEKGLSAVWTDLGPTFVGQTHDRLRQCCLAYITEIDIDTANLGIPDVLPKTSSTKSKELRHKTAKHFPFLQYAVENILWHADTAQAGGISQVKFLRELTLLAKLITLGNIFAPYENRRHYSTPSLLYILAEYNLPALIRINPNNCDCFVFEDQRYGPPIFAALACGSREAVTAMLEVQERLHGEDCARAKDWESTGKDTLSSFSREFWFSRKTGVFGYLKKIDDPVLMGFALGSSAVDLDPQNMMTGWTTTLLHIAVDLGNEAAVRSLLDHGYPNDLEDPVSRTPLLLAVVKGHESIVRLLLDRGAAIEASGRVSTDNGRTPLALAAKNGHKTLVQLLLDRGAAIEAKEFYGWTPLAVAASYGQEAVLRLLLDHGATIDPKDRGGMTPLAIAVERGYEAVVQLLLDRGATIEPKDEFGFTPLALAVVHRQKALVPLLLDRGAIIDANCNGKTPLILAAQNAKEDFVQLLLDRGAAIEAKDPSGKTPLALAARNGYKAVVQLLLDRGAAIDAKDCDGRTPLALAAEYGREAIVQFLLDRGAAVEATGCDGQTPLALATKSKWNDHTAVVQLLLDYGATYPGSKRL